MIIVLTTSRGPIGVEPSSVRVIVPNKADSACTISFTESHSIEVIGALAKIRTKLSGDTGENAAPAKTEEIESADAAPAPRPARAPASPGMRPRSPAR